MLGEMPVNRIVTLIANITPHFLTLHHGAMTSWWLLQTEMQIVHIQPHKLDAFIWLIPEPQQQVGSGDLSWSVLRSVPSGLIHHSWFCLQHYITAGPLFSCRLGILSCSWGGEAMMDALVRACAGSHCKLSTNHSVGVSLSKRTALTHTAHLAILRDKRERSRRGRSHFHAETNVRGTLVLFQ